MSNFEKKYGKYAIHNLTLVLIGCYIVGYLMKLVNPDSLFLSFLTLNPERILHGQIWRVVTWLLVPPDSLDIFTVIMLFFYYSIGTVVERTIGAYRYNLYLFTGMGLTVLGSFVSYGLTWLIPELIPPQSLIFWLAHGTSTDVFTYSAMWGSLFFSTYYINLSIFLAYAIIYPEMQVLLMFIVPVKVKWLGIIDLVLIGYEFFVGNIYSRCAIGAALINVLVFYLKMRMSHMKPSEIKRRQEFKKQVKVRPVVTRHKCAICGQTEEMNPDLEFRFCSKCNGNYEYCQEHLFTHEHVK